ncbi:MAG: hypothetical protein KDD55_02620 [Bdellovibrionales bacterium]|nr:hypothetical protein [Bdellovibrionales bacterium]
MTDENTAESKDINEEVPPPTETTVPPPTLGESFIRYGAGLQSEEDILHGSRLTPNGLFISEHLLTPLLGAFSTWHQEHHEKHTVLDHAKGIKKLFHSDKPQLSYLLDGKTCLVGFLIPGTFHERDKLPFPFYRGSLLEAKNYLHMRDPFLKELRDAEEVTDAKGFRIKIISGQTPLFVTNQVLLHFAELARASNQFVKRHPAVVESIRAVIPALCSLWRKAPKVSKEKKLLIPHEWRGNKSVTFHFAGEFIFVVDKEHSLVGVFGSKGKNLHELLISEFNDLKKKSKGKRLRSFSFEHKGRCLGTVPSERDGTFLVEPTAFKEFIDKAVAHTETRKKLPHLYTVRDCLELLGQTFHQTDWSEPYQLPRNCIREGIPDARYRTTKDWVFVLRGKRNIIGCIDRSKGDERPQDRRRPSNKGKSRRQQKPRRTSS